MGVPDVVISGIGGYFPQSNNVQDFGRDLLANKCLPEATNRWKYGEMSFYNVFAAQQYGAAGI